MASSRLASVITLSAGTKTNSAILVDEFLDQPGQATLSTLTRSRVIHFIVPFLCEIVLFLRHHVSDSTRRPPWVGEIT